MTVGETHVPHQQEQEPARVIPFPRGAYEEDTPKIEHIAMPDSKAFLQALSRKNVSTDTTGAQILLFLYEELGLIPKKEELEAAKARLTERQTAAAEYNALQEQAQVGPRLTQFKAKLKKRDLTLEAISPEAIAAITDEYNALVEQRKPLQDQVAIIEKNFQAYIDGEPGDEKVGFGDKIEALYNATDDLIEGDEFLELAAKMRKDALSLRSSTLTEVARTFERFTRFMIYDELRFYAAHSVDTDSEPESNLDDES